MIKETHLNILDILRGIAASLVCMFHFSGDHLPKLTNKYTRSLFVEGGIGVYIFFVISGFIIPYVLWRSSYTPSFTSYFRFLLKRFVRICPASYCSVILLIVEWMVIDYFFNSSVIYMKLFSLTDLIANLLYIAPFLGLPWFNGVFWTLTIEFQFYFFIGLFFSLLFKNKLNLIVSSISLSSVVLFLPFNFMDVESISRHLFINYYLFFAIGFITLSIRMKQINTIWFYSLLICLVSIAFFKFNSIIAISATATSLAILYLNLKSIVLEFLGKISYSLYLIHMIAGSAFEGLLTKFINVDNDFLKVVMQLLAFAFSIGCAYLFFLIIEKPAINFSKRFFKSVKPHSLVQPSM